MSKTGVLLLFFTGFPLMGCVCFLFIMSGFEPAGEVLSANTAVSADYNFGSVPKVSQSGGAFVEEGDARVRIVREWLESFDSPLAPHAEDLVEAADLYDLDFRLLAAISRQESNGCKYIPPGGHNCWGWGIHKRGTLGFDSYREAIFTVSKGLRENYVDDGLITPEMIMRRYTPSSPGTWSNAVEQFMAEME